MHFLRATLVLALLVSLTHSQGSIQHDPDAAKAFYILEEALLSDNVTLYQLQRLFYPPKNVATVTASINIDIIVNNTNSTSCYYSGCGFYNETCNCYKCNFQWTSQAVNKRIELRQFLFSGSACQLYLHIDFAAVQLLSFFTQVLCEDYYVYDDIDSPNSANIRLKYIEKLNCDGDFSDALFTLVSWVSLHG